MDRSLALALSLWVLGKFKGEELPEIATEWLVNGLDSPSLRELAAVGSPIMSEVGPLFEKVLAELEIRKPSRDEALMCLARHYASQILTGRFSPYEGARKIWWEVTSQVGRPSQLLLTFVGAVSELDDLPERTSQDGYDRRTYERELEELIVSSARALLDEGSELGATRDRENTATSGLSGL